MNDSQPKLAPPELRAPNTPASVVVTLEPAPPVASNDLGIAVALPAKKGNAPHPLVTIGDSLTHGFQSGAIFNTDLSWPVLVARAGGYQATFNRPHYPKFGGLPPVRTCRALRTATDLRANASSVSLRGPMPQYRQ